MKRVKTLFAGREVEFIDRDQAIKQVEELAEKGTWVVYVIYGPEGCGKTAFFRQASEVLREHGYAVVHVNPLARAVEDRFSVAEDLRELAVKLGAYPVGDAAQLIDKAVELLYKLVREGIKKRIALLADGVFQAVGLDKAEQLVKSLLNMIEWPSIRCEKIVVLVASSERVTRERVGRHSWATMRIIWNMSREGFKKLYNTLPDPKPEFEEVWRLAGGNPRYLEEIYRSGWSVDRVVKGIVMRKRLEVLIASLGGYEREVLREAIEDPDVMLAKLRDPRVQELERKLIEYDLLMEVWDRDEWLWVDTPPRERDPELGIGKYYAWQTPLHREAVRRALERLEHRLHSEGS